MLGLRVGSRTSFVTALTVGMLACLAPAAAEAAPGIDLSWGNSVANVKEIKGGRFSVQLRGIAVNNTTGDVYVTDPGESGLGGVNENERIQRFSASGAFISAWGKNVDASNPSTGYEVCTVAENCKAGEAGTLGGEFTLPGGIAIDQQSGDVYVIDTGNRRVQEFDPQGAFIRALGLDVVKTGEAGDNPAASAKQALTVGASSGEYTLEFEGQKTIELPVGASAPEIQAALIALPVIGTGNLEVTGAGSPFMIAFKGALANNTEPPITAISGPANPLGGGGASVAVLTAGSSGFEICEAAAKCQAGTSGSGAGAFGIFGEVKGGNNPGAGSGLAVAPAGATNAGDVLVADAGNQRLEEFNSSGQFVRAFGWDTVAAGPGNDLAAPANEFEVCRAATFDACKGGSIGSGKGQFATATPTRVAEDSSGRIYTVEPTENFRLQRFTLPVDVPTPQGEFAAPALHGSVARVSEAKDNTTEVGVDGTGNVYAVKAFPTGTGTPPAAPEGAGAAPWQQRILKLDPVSEETIEVMAVNPGSVSEIQTQLTSFEDITGLAVTGAGPPIYATTAGSGVQRFQERARVWRLKPITGLGANGIEAGEVGSSTAKLEATIIPAAIQLGSAYRFEYSADGVNWKPAPLADAQIGNGSAGGESSSCSTNLQAAICHVFQKIAGLTPNSTYQLRLVLYTLFDKGQATVLPGGEFTTRPAPPVIANVIAHWSSPAAQGPSLFLGGTLNPGHGATTYYFQYVSDAAFQADLEGAKKNPLDLVEAEEKCAGDSHQTQCEEERLREHGFDHSTRVPEALAEAGDGLEDVSVDEVVAGLNPSVPYRYRLVATNPVASATSSDQLLSPPAASERFYELVSVGDSGGAGTYPGVGAVADSGARATFYAQSFGNPRGEPSFVNGFISQRGPSGWAVSDTSPEGADSASVGGNFFAADLGAELWSAGQGTETQVARSEGTLQRAEIAGSLTEVAPLVPLQRTGIGHYALEGASADLSRAIFGFTGLGAVTLVPGEGLVASGRSNLYEASEAGGGSATISIVNRADGKAGAVLGGSCGASLPKAPHAISIDGASVYFYAFPNAPEVGSACTVPGARRLYERSGGEMTVEVSKSRCSRISPPCKGEAELNGEDEFKGASADGQILFFASKRQLTSSDEDETLDLFAYDRSPPAGQPNLVQVSAGETVGGHTTGSGAKVLGMLDNAQDGSRVYFVAEGMLSGANAMGKAPVANRPNLYAYERDAVHPVGRIAFVGQLTPGPAVGDGNEWLGGEEAGKQSQALPVPGDGSGDGRSLLFITKSKLLIEDTDSAKDLYLYDDNASEAAKMLLCLSCHGSPGAPIGAGNGEGEVRVTGRQSAPLADYAQEQRVASADLSTVVFATPERLSGEDRNDTWDAYAWHEGQIELLSGITGVFGIPGLSERQVAISSDGKNVFFVTRAALVGGDTNNTTDLYDARVGGGFPEVPRPMVCEDAERCQGPPAPPPAASSTSSEAAGAGNPPIRPAVKCPKGKVQRNEHCVKVARHNAKKHHKVTKHHERGDQR